VFKQILIAASIVLVGFNALAEPVQLQLKTSVYRGQSPVLIKDVFTIKADNKSLIKTIGEKPLSWHSANGWHFVDELLNNLKVKPTITGSKKLWLALCKPVDVSALTATVSAMIQVKLAETGKKIKLTQVKPLTAGKRKCLPLDTNMVASSLNWTNPIKHRLSSNHQLSDGKTLQLWWQGEFSVYAPVATQVIKANQTVKADMVSFSWISADNSALRQTIAQGSLTGYRSKRRINVGQPVNHANAQQIPDVDKGEQVTLIYSHEGIHIESAAKALSAGNTGDSIMVLVAKAKGPVKGKIKRKGVVHAIF
jgi:flagella basal body P-ring formation protein FlgA